MFGGRGRIINDVAAAAWAVSYAERPSMTQIFGSPPDFRADGHWVLVNFEPNGVGAATIKSDAGRGILVGESEGGTAGFAPRTIEDFTAAQRLRGLNGHVSWEQILCAASGDFASSWAALAGDFVGDLILTTGAWSGAIIAGKSSHALLRTEASDVFRDRMIKKQKCGRYLALSSLSAIGKPDILMGCRRYAEANGLMVDEASALNPS